MHLSKVDLPLPLGPIIPTNSLFPISIFIFLIWADVLSRIVIKNAELPIGILISMIGAPCFVYLMIKKSYGFGGVN